jgi:hypothetical protein
MVTLRCGDDNMNLILDALSALMMIYVWPDVDLMEHLVIEREFHMMEIFGRMKGLK